MLALPVPPWSSGKPRQLPASSASMSRQWTFGASRISRPRSERSRMAQALYVCPDPLVNANHARINTLALGARLPTMHPFRDFLGTGGFMSYGANTADMFRRAGDYVDKILRGAKPAELPVEQPTKFDLVINLIAAKALRLEVSPTLLARADEVIE